MPQQSAALPRDVAPTVAPVRIAVAGLPIDQPVLPEGVDGTGAMSLPADPANAGWWKFGPGPTSTTGTTVVAAHVDAVGYGIGPFAHLVDVPTGTAITVTGADGSATGYRVAKRRPGPEDRGCPGRGSPTSRTPATGAGHLRRGEPRSPRRPLRQQPRGHRDTAVTDPRLPTVTRPDALASGQVPIAVTGRPHDDVTITPPDDSALADAFGSGDERVLRSVYERWSPLVHTLALRSLSDVAAAEDVTQQVFVLGLAASATYDPAKAPLGAWLVGIARNCITDAHTERTRRTRLTIAVAGEEAAAPMAEDVTDGLAERVMVAGELDRLDEVPGRSCDWRSTRNSATVRSPNDSTCRSAP